MLSRGPLRFLPSRTTAVAAAVKSLRLATVAVFSASLVAAAAPLSAQSLRGSHASVSLVYRRAVRGGLDFYETNSQLQRRPCAVSSCG
jgi:hypothetical protein